MSASVPEKLRKLAADIAANGSAELTRLTVLKKWFERPERLSAFALWMARRMISLNSNADGEAGNFFREAKSLLKGLDPMHPVLPPERIEKARSLYERLQALQNVYRTVYGTQVRTISNWDLMLVEKGLEILLHPYAAPTYGYRLAADCCQHYDPRYGPGLNGPSGERILELMRWASRVENAEAKGAG